MSQIGSMVCCPSNQIDVLGVRPRCNSIFFVFQRMNSCSYVSPVSNAIPWIWEFLFFFQRYLLNKTQPICSPIAISEAPQPDNIINQGEHVSAGGFSSFSDGLWCLFFNRNWALSKHKFLFQSKRFHIRRHLCFMRMSILFLLLSW